MRRPLRRLAAWWERRRGRRGRLLGFLAGPGDDAEGGGVREPRRPRTPSLSGAATVDLPGTEDEPRG